MKTATIVQYGTRLISILLMLGLVCFAPSGVASSATKSPTAVWLVDIPIDLPIPAIIIDGVCLPGNCTFREAVMEANAAGGGTINFIPPLITLLPPAGGGSPIIIVNNVLIVGPTFGFPIIQDAGNSPTLQLAGNGNLIQNLMVTGSASDAILISGSGNTVTDTIIVNNIYGAAVHISGGSNNTVTRSLLGIFTNDTCQPNRFGVHLDGNASNNTISHSRISCNSFDGILVDSAPPAWQVNLTTIDTNSIGTDSTDAIAKPNIQNGIRDIQSKNTAIDYNLISGNGGEGICLTGSEGAKITRNYIGTNGSGISAVPNGSNGILIEDAGDDSGLVNNIEIRDGNVISGNGQFGVRVTGAYMDNVTIKDNIIGLNAAGTATVPNTDNGVLIYQTSHVTVGGPNPATDRNVISGNRGSGVGIQSASDILVDSNYIGLDGSGSSGLANAYAGVEIECSECSNIVIGSLPPYVTIPDQYISGNGEEGVLIVGAPGVVIGPRTFIGVAADGIAPVGNGRHGLAFSNVIGADVHSQIIANNGITGKYAGVAVMGTSTGVEIRPVLVNSTWKMKIAANSGLPIDLNFDGHTPNDAGDGDAGPNTLLNYPVVTSLVGTTISGTICNNCEVHVYQAFYNPAMNDGGGIYLARFTASGTTWTGSLPPDTDMGQLTFVAYDPATGDTSEMSPRPLAFLPMIFRP